MSFGNSASPDRPLHVIGRRQRRRPGLGVVVEYRGADGLRHPVQHDVRQQLVLAEAVLDVAVGVGPRVKAVHDPRREADRRIVEAGREASRPGRLHHRVGAVGHEVLLGRLQILLLGLRQRRRIDVGDVPAQIGQVDADRRLRDDRSPGSAQARCRRLRPPRRSAGSRARRSSVARAAARCAGSAGPGVGRCTGPVKANPGSDGTTTSKASLGSPPARRIAECRDDLVESVEGVRPAVKQQQGHGARGRVPSRERNGCRPRPRCALNCGERVEPRLVMPPVIARAPVAHQLAQIRGAGAEVPASFGDDAGSSAFARSLICRSSSTGCSTSIWKGCGRMDIRSLLLGCRGKCDRRAKGSLCSVDAEPPLRSLVSPGDRRRSLGRCKRRRCP